MTRYFLGLGSNINPRRHLPLMVEALLELAPTLHVGRVLETAPVGVVGDPFLNAPVCLTSNLAPMALKAWTNALEARLGRDRAAPDSKHRSRSADLDILFSIADEATRVPPDLLPPEPYMRPLLLELLAFLGIATEAEQPAPGPGVRLELAGLARLPPKGKGGGPTITPRVFGEYPVTIFRRNPIDI